MSANDIKPAPDHRAFAALSDMYDAAKKKATILTNFTRDNGACGYATLSFFDQGLIAAHGGKGEVAVRCGAFQALHHKEAVAQAMADALASHGFASLITSVMD